MLQVSKLLTQVANLASSVRCAVYTVHDTHCPTFFLHIPEPKLRPSALDVPDNQLKKFDVTPSSPKSDMRHRLDTHHCNSQSIMKDSTVQSN